MASFGDQHIYFERNFGSEIFMMRKYTKPFWMWWNYEITIKWFQKSETVGSPPPPGTHRWMMWTCPGPLLRQRISFISSRNFCWKVEFQDSSSIPGIRLMVKKQARVLGSSAASTGCCEGLGKIICFFHSTWKPVGQSFSSRFRLLTLSHPLAKLGSPH